MLHFSTQSIGQACTICLPSSCMRTGAGGSFHCPPAFFYFLYYVSIQGDFAEKHDKIWCFGCSVTSCSVLPSPVYWSVLFPHPPKKKAPPEADSQAKVSAEAQPRQPSTCFLFVFFSDPKLSAVKARKWKMFSTSEHQKMQTGWWNWPPARMWL